ncbi:MAG: flavin reductase [Chloroflexi bacterium]|nr:flavin reductase [Chloroflexota bacterium]|tara:strand:- start:245 stop:718 length:474 start_codon:yes stop_codon:yes gene_type:complete
MIEKKLKDAWSMFPTGVSIITSTDDQGNCHGMTANGIMSLSITPPLVLISVDVSRDTHSYIVNKKKFGINILSNDQKEIADYYAAPSKFKNTSNINWSINLNSDIYFISNSLVNMGCKVINSFEEADHTLFIGLVLNVEIKNKKPLVWFNRFYSDLV